MQTDPAWADAKAALQGKRFEEAIVHLEKVIENDDEDADAYCLMGAAYGALHRYLEAEFYLSRACEIDDTSPVIHFNLGRTFEARKRIEDAIRCYENSLRANRAYAPARQALERLHATLSPDLREPEPPEPDEAQGTTVPAAKPHHG